MIDSKGLYDNVISTVGDFLTNDIQALQHHWKKCVGHERDYVKK